MSVVGIERGTGSHIGEYLVNYALFTVSCFLWKWVRKESRFH